MGAERSRALARWCRGALEVSAGAGYAAFLFALAEELGERAPGAELLRWLAALALVLVPLFPATLERRLAFLGPGRARLAAWLAQLAPLAALGLVQADRPGFTLIGALVLLQGNLLVRGNHDRLAAWSLALGPALVLCCMDLAPGPEWLLLFPLSLLCAFAALVLVSARSSEREVRERAPRVLFGGARSEPREPARALGRRVLASVRPALALLLLLPPAYSLVMLAREPLERLWGNETSSAAGDSEATRSQRAAAADRRAPRERGPAGRFPSTIAYGDQVQSLRGEAVMEIAPSFPSGTRARPPALYMRGLVLDAFHAQGSEFGGGIEPRRLRAGSDGWTRLSIAHEAELELEVVLEPLFLGESWSNVLFAPHPLAAVDRPRVLYHPDDRLALPVAPQDTIRYRLRAPWPREPGAPLPATRARHPDPRYLALPPACEELDRIAERARELTAGATGDAERVELVLDHFRATFAYSLESRAVPGLAGLIEFLRRRSGHCTHFALAASLMLRSLGIPARVATGYLADAWIPEEGIFRVTSQNAHAWIEVAFEEVGWVSCDPTPPDRRVAALAALGAPRAGLVGWLAELRDQALSWSSTGGHESYLRAFFAKLLEGPRALLGSSRRELGTLALLLAALLALWSLRRSRARAAERPELPPARAAAADDMALLLRALERNGHRRRPAQTLRELARQLSAQEELARLPSLAEGLQRARYGGEALSASERERLAELLARLARSRAGTAARSA